MRSIRMIIPVTVALALAGADTAMAQGKGHQHGGSPGGQGGGHAAHGNRGGGQGQARTQGGGQQRQAQRAQERGRSGQARAARPSRGGEARSERGSARSSARTPRAAERSVERGAPGRARAALVRSRATGVRIAGNALDRGRGRGLNGDAVRVAQAGSRVRLLNRRGDVLLDMDDDRVREMGAWRLRRMGDRPATGNAPAFCRNGAGHPVWGREWCLDKGFGLGSGNGTLWSRGVIDDVVFQRYPERLDRSGLIDVLGDIVFGRVALQAVTLGYDQPLMGVWLAPTTGPRSLVLTSAGYPVAEFVDLDRDDRVEVLYVLQPL